MVDWQNVFRPQRQKVQEHICVFYDAILRVLVGAVFKICGTRNVSRQHLRQLNGIASESLVHSHELNSSIRICIDVIWPKKRLRILRFTCLVCSWDRTVLFCFHRLRACGQVRTRRIFKSMSIVCIYLYMYMYLSHVERIHTQRMLIMSVAWWCLFLSVIIGVQSVADVAVRALSAPSAIMVSRRLWDSSSNVV